MCHLTGALHRHGVKKNKDAKAPGTSKVIKSWAALGVDLAALSLTAAMVPDSSSSLLHRAGCRWSAFPHFGYDASMLTTSSLERYLKCDLCSYCLGSAEQFGTGASLALENLVAASMALEHLGRFDKRLHTYRTLTEDATLKTRAKGLEHVVKALIHALAFLETRADSAAGLENEALADLVERAETAASTALAEFTSLAQASGVAAYFTAKAYKRVRSYVDFGVPGLLGAAHASRRTLLRPALLALDTEGSFWDFAGPQSVTILASFGFNLHRVVLPTCVALAFFADADNDVVGSALLKRSDSPAVIGTALALFRDGHPDLSLPEQLKTARALEHP